MDVDEYFYHIQEYVAWCFRDVDGNEGRPIRTFHAPISSDVLMDPQTADGEIVDPPPVIQKLLDM